MLTIFHISISYSVFQFHTRHQTFEWPELGAKEKVFFEMQNGATGDVCMVGGNNIYTTVNPAWGKTTSLQAGKYSNIEILS